MTSLPPSNSESVGSVFALLHPKIQRWIWDKGWDELRDIQAKAIPAILNGTSDIIISAATAGGKTEAAFLPILSAVAEDPAPGFKILYVSPLKALINDQFRRLDDLCERLELPVFRWHGDVSDAIKRRAREKPEGIVLITPESLEALLIRRAVEIPRLFASLRFIVIDELHAFIGSERGVQLQSLLRRLETITGSSAFRIGLSATLGEMRGAAAHLRPSDPDKVAIIESRGSGQELRVQVRAYVEPERIAGGADDETPEPSVAELIADHLFERLRGTHNLVFAGSRRRVEYYADRLRQLCEGKQLPNEFFPHHGSLARDLREEVERRLRDGNLPTTAVCTTTLELGIDIGAVESVAQIGPPRSIAALRQRLGRSGRRKDKPAVLRIYIEERSAAASDHPIHRLHTDLVQAIAAVRLLVERWYEPPTPRALHLSTLLHQVLALIAQNGGAYAHSLYAQLSGCGPFEAVSQNMFIDLLRTMGNPERALIEQAPDGTLMLGKAGERLVEHYSFYAVFESTEEYRVEAGGRILGTIPIDSPLVVDGYIIFAGRRWRVRAVDELRKLVQVEPAGGGRPPSFGGYDGTALHDQLVSEMRKVYEEESLPGFVDAAAAELLMAGRQTYRDLDLGRAHILATGDRVLLLPWVGSRKLETLALALQSRGLKCIVFSIGVEVMTGDPDQVLEVLRTLSTSPPQSPEELGAMAQNKASQKYDSFLPEELLVAEFARRNVDADSIPTLAAALLG